MKKIACIMIAMMFLLLSGFSNDCDTNTTLKETDLQIKKEEEPIEYEYATTVWNFLQEQGYNDYVCAGILGNMMAECGGHTLDLQPQVYSPMGTYYGICQWSLYYFPEVNGKSLTEQLEFLESNIKENFDIFGINYQYNFNYESFKALQNERDAALAFVLCYGRGGWGTYELRQDFATTAYNYFIK